MGGAGSLGWVACTERNGKIREGQSLGDKRDRRIEALVADVVILGRFWTRASDGGR